MGDLAREGALSIKNTRNYLPKEWTTYQKIQPTIHFQEI